MQKRKLGNSGLEVSAIGLGCMSMTPIYGVPDTEEAIATLHVDPLLGFQDFHGRRLAYEAGIDAEPALRERGRVRERAQQIVDAGFTPLYDYALQTLKELPYARWRD